MIPSTSPGFNETEVLSSNTTWQDSSDWDGALIQNLYWDSTYSYYVTARNHDEITTSFGPPDSLLANGIPAQPQNLAGESIDSSIVLTWAPNSEPDIKYYRIFRDNSVAQKKLSGNTIEEFHTFR